jgi:hypothetical protein
MPRPIRKSKAPVYAVYICIVIAIAVLAPAIVTFGWHLAHSAEQDYAGYRITIPQGYIVVRSSNQLRLIRARTVFSTAFYQISGAFLDQTGQHVDLARWQSEVAKGSPPSAALQTFSANMGGTALGCYQSAASDGKWHVGCVSQDGLNLGYSGDLDTIRELRAIFEGARKL